MRRQRLHTAFHKKVTGVREWIKWKISTLFNKHPLKSLKSTIPTPTSFGSFFSRSTAGNYHSKR